MGAAAIDRTGTTVGEAGDFNSDGFDGFLIGGQTADTGDIFLVFGSAAGQPAEFNLPALDGSNGVQISGYGFTASLTGTSASGAGDFNGDGFDDLIIGAPIDDTAGADAGASYIVFGSAPRSAPA